MRVTQSIAVLLGTMVAGAPVRAIASDPPSPSTYKTLQDESREQATKDAAAKARRSSIREELKALSIEVPAGAPVWTADWAGTYSWGSSFAGGDAVSLAPKAGFVHTLPSCIGSFVINHGAVVQSHSDGVTVNLVDPRPTEVQATTERLYFVRWGERRYLASEAQVTEIANFYNTGDHQWPEQLAVPVRDEDRAGKVWGVPEVPQRFMSQLVTEPLECAITTVRAWRPAVAMPGTIATLSLDKGSAEGLFVGMNLNVSYSRTYPGDSAPTPRTGRVTITSLSEHSAEGEFRSLHNDGSKTPQAPSRGDKATVGARPLAPPSPSPQK